MAILREMVAAEGSGMSGVPGGPGRLWLWPVVWAKKCKGINKEMQRKSRRQKSRTLTPSYTCYGGSDLCHGGTLSLYCMFFLVRVGRRSLRAFCAFRSV